MTRDYAAAARVLCPKDTGAEPESSGLHGLGSALLWYGGIFGGLFLLANVFAGPDTRGMSRAEKQRRGLYD